MSEVISVINSKPQTEHKEFEKNFKLISGEINKEIIQTPRGY